jgi:DNA-binding CsgD family transcriptional regulator
MAALIAAGLPFVLVREHGPLAGAHWARWNRGPIVATLVNPGPADWDLIDELGVPAIVVHSQPLGSPEFGRALASGANSLVPADKIDDHFLAVLRMVSQGYLVADSLPMRSLIGVVRTADNGELPELTAREGDILQSAARGYTIRQTARALGISPKTVENIQTRLFRKLGVRNRAAALAAADALTGAARSRSGMQVVKTDPLVAGAHPSSTSTRWRTLWIIPRIWGESGCSTLCPIRRRPSERSVSRCR